MHRLDTEPENFKSLAVIDQKADGAVYSPALIHMLGEPRNPFSTMAISGPFLLPFHLSVGRAR